MGTASSILVEESPIPPSELVDCSKRKQRVKATPSRRGRTRVLLKKNGGIRSRSISRSWNNKTVTFMMHEPIKYKEGISMKKARGKRVFQRCLRNKEARKAN